MTSQELEQWVEPEAPWHARSASAEVWVTGSLMALPVWLWCRVERGSRRNGLVRLSRSDAYDLVEQILRLLRDDEERR